MEACGPDVNVGALGVLMPERFDRLFDRDGALPLYLLLTNVLSDSGCDRSSLLLVLKTVG